MDFITNLIWSNGKLLGIEWSVWKIVGWLGNAIFFSRFFVQWYVTEKKKQVTVPVAFWWLSLAGSLLLLIYALRKTDSVFIFAYLFPWIPYLRNLIIHYRHEKAHTDCANCGQKIPPRSNFCPNCGVRVS
ncbi:MAG TPA: lipid-A-disaccharide synthase N-terminal domain-containing protein [Verrucomicrobiae bacterium]|nr:lipid-A-disaccharide synthase N-terminal domain-containing protein [Verrucomicrobiae bacterium]